MQLNYNFVGIFLKFGKLLKWVFRKIYSEDAKVEITINFNQKKDQKIQNKEKPTHPLIDMVASNPLW